MLCYKCVEKVRNKAGKIVSYQLKNTNGVIVPYKPDDLYRAICNSELRCVNLKISRNNRIIDEKNILDFDIDIFNSCMIRAKFMQGIVITPDLIYDMYMSIAGRERFSNLQKYFVCKEIWRCVYPDEVFPYLRQGEEGTDIVFGTCYIKNGTFVIQDFVTSLYDNKHSQQLSYTHFPVAVSLKVINRSSCSNMTQLFSDMKYLKELDLSQFNTSKVTCMKEMFKFSQLLEKLDMSGMDFSHVTDMRGIFYGCKSLTSIDFSGFDLSSVKSMHSAFASCLSLQSVNLSHCNAASLEVVANMFSNCKQLKRVNVTGITSDKLQDTSGMFSLCVNLDYLDLRTLNTSNVNIMHNMFDACGALKELKQNFDVSNVIDFSRMFYCCRNLVKLDTSNFRTNGAHKCFVRYMFSACMLLKEIDVSGITMIFSEDGATGLFASCVNVKKVKFCGFIENLGNPDSLDKSWLADTLSSCTSLEEIHTSQPVIEFLKRCRRGASPRAIKFVPIN